MITSKPPSKRKQISIQEWCERISGKITWIRQRNILLQYYTTIDPYALSTEEWGRKVFETQWIRQKEAEANKVD